MIERLQPERLHQYVTAVFSTIGILPAHAEVTATRLVEADLRGRGGHGLIRVRPWARRVMAGAINTRPEIRVEHEMAASALVDGDNGIGPAVVTMATEKAIALAEQSGVAWVGTRRSNHAGAAGVYTALARQRGLIALYIAVAAGNSVPPWGGLEPLMGTNPIAISIPSGDEVPFELDIATTVASHGSIREKALAGEALPEGWVVGRDGRPITDPARADEGLLLPMGGHKGAGLDFMIGVLAGVLNGAAFGKEVVADSREPGRASNTGQALLVLRPDLFLPRDEFLAEMDRQLATFRASKSASDQPVRLPGERAAATEEARRRDGIPIADPLLAELRALADELELADRLD
jgi:L-2-hydroxycarboxylate dehydrogenase (NAD+)